MKRSNASLNLGIFNMLKLFQLKSNELLVYNLLSKKPMTIKQLQKSTKMSERSLRTYLDNMAGRNFVKRKLIEGKHLKYVYYANSGDNLLDIIKNHVEELEKKRLKRRDEIIKGTEENINA
ncbi:MAG: transcriptional regulator [Candidatus Aenigmarchaeota archaeon]|nr:transcriptional regulator [Candidatus Aenigmarchaeota archaeon]